MVQNSSRWSEIFGNRMASRPRASYQEPGGELSTPTYSPPRPTFRRRCLHAPTSVVPSVCTYSFRYVESFFFPMVTICLLTCKSATHNSIEGVEPGTFEWLLSQRLSSTLRTCMRAPLSAYLMVCRTAVEPSSHARALRLGEERQEKVRNMWMDLRLHVVTL
ncbi:uncharacterized protein BP01DRAFT_73651 [Aspergillus saccharolyticus JOP 1030-1]|uniref:Uncharacterized protein n=1 Tax=Aspergillus saccharolyticus JOP 1030-1 TaxID=1450539 RepID=A0A318ZRC0_9EURO|nr:hypothetical protein BP01DRAFT_73651 [Aspergillus saccharolyticus JOP 1030-1]PYH49205.1 hypothetical protein BP01DRAFT_73651 [Aspergillus saccharolyticus JOP 1030-1]